MKPPSDKSPRQMPAPQRSELPSENSAMTDVVPDRSGTELARKIYEQVFPAAMLHTLTSLGPLADPQAAHDYLQFLVASCGSTADPFLAALAVQFGVAQQQILQLQQRLQGTKTAEDCERYANAVARLIGEQRRLAMAIRELRQPYSPPHLTVVGQQNIAGHQQVAVVTGQAVYSPDLPPGAAGREKKTLDSQLRHKGESLDGRRSISDAEPEACRRRPEE